MMQLTVGRSLKLAAQSRPEFIAVTFENSNITHGQFEVQSNRIARAFIEIGLKKGLKYVESGPLVRSSYHAEKHLF